MKKYLRLAAIIIIAVLIVTTGVILGFNLVKDKNKNMNKLNIEANIEEALPSVPPTTKIEIIMPNEQKKVNENTKFIYEYHHLADGKTDTTEEDAPYFLYGKTEVELSQLFSEWEISSFENNQVIMRKNLEGMSNQYYIIGALNGYVAVFYKNEINGNNLKEVTDTPVSTLPIEIQEQLLKGINVVGEDNLDRMLEDYES